MVEVQFKQAEQAFHRGDLDRASAICEGILRERPDFPPAMLLSGLVEVRMGQTAKAVDTLKRALELSRDDYVGMSWLQLALRKEQRFREAVEIGERARSLWSRDPDVLVNLSHAYLGIRDIEKAAGCLLAAAKVRPNDGAIHRRLGIAYELLGKDQEAATEFETAIRLAPLEVESYVRLGRLLINHGNFTQAVELGRRALKVSPKSAQVHLVMAQAFKSLRDDESAYQFLRKAVTIDPNMEVSAAMWLQEEGKFDEATELFQKSIDRNPIQGIAYYGVVKGKKVTEKDRDFLHRMAQVLGAPGLPLPEKAALLYGLGKGANDLEEYETAMRRFDEGNRLNYQIYIAGKEFDSEELKRNREKIERTFTAEVIEKLRPVGSESDVPIFIVGMIRSGTTLVEQILSSHPEVGGAGEQRFWVNEIPNAVDLQTGRFDAEKFEELRDRYLRVLRSFQPDSRRITDKMPMNFYCAGLLHLAYPKSPIIHVRRHPIDTALSIWMTDLAKPPDFAHDKRNVVAEYRDYLAIMEHWRKVIPDTRMLEVRYEDLILDQESWTRRMLEFCGLEWDPACMSFYTSERSVSTPSAWQVRQPIYRTSVDKWRHYEPWLGEFAELRQVCSDYW